MEGEGKEVERAKGGRERESFERGCRFQSNQIKSSRGLTCAIVPTLSNKAGAILSPGATTSSAEAMGGGTKAAGTAALSVAAVSAFGFDAAAAIGAPASDRLSALFGQN